MGATETTRNEYLAFDHDFGLLLILLIALSSAGVMLWSLYRERRVLGTRMTTLFALLRCVAIATALWMLLAPTSVVEESTTTRKAVAILMDVSASMSIADPQGSSDDLRWVFAKTETTSDDVPGRMTAAADRGIVALSVAHRELSRAITAQQQHGAEGAVHQHLRLANRAVERSKIHLDAIRGDSVGAATGVGISDSLLQRLNRLLHSPEYDSLFELCETLRRGQTPLEAGWRESLPDLLSRTATARRVFEELGGTLAAAESEVLSETNSVSMRINASQARAERVASFLKKFGQSNLKAIERTVDLHWTLFDQTVRDVANREETTRLLAEIGDREELSQSTDLSAALRHIQRMQQDQPVAAAFVLSDVAHNQLERRDPADIAAQLESAPVFLIPIGNQSRLRDVDLVSTSAPAVAMRNDEVVIEVKLEAYQCLGDRLLVNLLRDGDVIDFRNLLIESDSASRVVRFEQLVPEIGKASFQIAVEPLDGEMTNENNFDEVEIHVTRSDIKVLLADELPRWEYRYLAQLLRRDPKVELDELLYRPRLIATGRRSASGSFPVTVAQWNQYDIVILGDLPPDHFPAAAQKSLLKYMQTRGGTVIAIAGDRAMPQAYTGHPLHEVIPVRPIEEDEVEPDQGYSFQVTESGRSHVALMIGETEQATRDAWAFVNRFSPLHKVSRWQIPLPTARSLIAAVPRRGGETETGGDALESTFLCWQPVGRGRLVYLSAPDTYRLRFLRGDQYHHRFWGQLMRWAIASDLAAGNRSIRIRTSKGRYDTDQTIEVEVELLEPDGSPLVSGGEDGELYLQLRSGDDERQTPLVAEQDRPGHYRAEVRSLPPGVYQVRPAGDLVVSLSDGEIGEPAVATFTVQADLPTELIDTRCNRALAGQLSELTGGQVLPPTAVAEVLELTDLEPVVTHHVERRPLWLRWKYLWLVFGCLQTEWIIRKWRGLS